MTVLRKAATLVLISVEPGVVVLGVLGILLLAIIAAIAFVAIYSRDPVRRDDARAVLQTLLGK